MFIILVYLKNKKTERQTGKNVKKKNHKIHLRIKTE